MNNESTLVRVTHDVAGAASVLVVVEDDTSAPRCFVIVEESRCTNSSTEAFPSTPPQIRSAPT